MIKFLARITARIQNASLVRTMRETSAQANESVDLLVADPYVQMLLDPRELQKLKSMKLVEKVEIEPLLKR